MTLTKPKDSSSDKRGGGKARGPHWYKSRWPRRKIGNLQRKLNKWTRWMRIDHGYELEVRS